MLSNCVICSFKGNTSSLSNHYKSTHGLTSEEYFNIKSPNSTKHCLLCNKPLVFINTRRGYGKYCCQSHAMKHRNILNPSMAIEASKIGAPIGGKRTKQLHPELYKIWGKNYHINHPGESSRRLKEFHKNNPFFASNRNKDPNDSFGKRFVNKTTYNNIPMKSSWEAEFAKICDEHFINWKYEFKTFDLIFKRYTPDFYLPDYDIWIEIKPVFYQTEELDIIKQNIGVKLVVLDKGDYTCFINSLLNSLQPSSQLDAFSFGALSVY